MKLNFEIYDSLDDALIGNGIILIKELLNNKNNPFSLELDDPINNYQIGTLKINLKMIKKNSFIDYLKGGMQINMEIAIDYTASNGDPQKPSSYHYINGHFPNCYENAIKQGREMRFFITANPVIKKNGKRVPLTLCRTKNQDYCAADWIRDRIFSAGAMVSQSNISNYGCHVIKKGKEDELNYSIVKYTKK